MEKVKKYIIDNKELMKEWDWEKNNQVGYDPKIISIGSYLKVFWRCNKCQNSWQAVIKYRTKNKPTGCPYCSNQKVLKGFNDFETNYPELLKEWNYKRNNCTPDTIYKASTKKVWWICSQGHEWEVSPNNRTRGRGCPICAKEK